MLVFSCMLNCCSSGEKLVICILNCPIAAEILNSKPWPSSRCIRGNVKGSLALNVGEPWLTCLDITLNFAASVNKNHVSIKHKNQRHSLCVRHRCCDQKVTCTCHVYATYRFLCVTSAFANTHQTQNMILIMTESRVPLEHGWKSARNTSPLLSFTLFIPFSRCLHCCRQALEMRRWSRIEKEG